MGKTGRSNLSGTSRERGDRGVACWRPNSIELGFPPRFFRGEILHAPQSTSNSDGPKLTPARPQAMSHLGGCGACRQRLWPLAHDCFAARRAPAPANSQLDKCMGPCQQGTGALGNTSRDTYPCHTTDLRMPRQHALPCPRDDTGRSADAMTPMRGGADYRFTTCVLLLPLRFLAVLIRS